ncbi:MAG: START domain-containing protein [Candidatus Omnitrophica bacterium]|nr:START domain-containing protein [Candidatus Omnitrophota bacterium]
MRSSFFVVFLMFLGFSGSFDAVAATDHPWRQRINEDGITVDTRKVDRSSLLEFKASIRMDVSIEKVVSVLEDPKKMPLWYHQCVYAQVVDEEGPLQKICYLVLHLPWPVSERDSVFRLVKEEDSKSGILTYTLNAVTDYLPRKRGKIRVPYLKAFWRLTPLSDGTTEVFVQQHSDPGGWVPPSLVNKLVVDVPFMSLKNLRDLVSRE